MGVDVVARLLTDRWTHVACQRQDVTITVGRGPSIRGRDRERNAINGCIDKARAGRFAVIRILGEPGVGKTILCDYAAEVAGPEFEVVRASGVEGEATLPLAALSLILRPLATHFDGLSSSLRRIVDAVLATGDRAVDDPYALGAAVLAVLSATAESGPLLLVVDDTQWLDDPSDAALSFALRRLDIDAVAAVMSGRPAAKAVTGPGETMQLIGLERGDALGVLTDQAADFAPDVADAVLAATGGNPLALVEVARQLSPEQRSGATSLPDPLPVGGHLVESYRRLLAPLPDDCRLVLATVAAAGSAAALVGPALDRLGLSLDAVGPAEEAEVVSADVLGIHFRHPLLRAAALDLVGGDQRRRVHGALANAAVGDPERYAAHLAASCVGPSDEVAEALLVAASVAERRGGLSAAAGVLERAALTTPAGETRDRRLVAAAQALLMAGRHQAALRRLDEVLSSSADDALRAEASLARTQLMLWGADANEATESARQQARRLAPIHPARAVGSLVQAAVGMIMRGNLSEAITLARDADALARSGTGASWLARPVLAGAVVLTGRRQEADRLLDRAAVKGWLRTAASGGALDVTRLPFIYLGLALSWCERRDEAARVLERMTDIHRRASAPYGLAFLVSALGENLWWLGRWAEATAYSEEALALTEQSHQDVLGGFVGAITARSLGCRGQADRARELVKEALGVAEALGLSFVRLYALHARGLTELACGRVAEAAQALQEADELAGELGVGDPSAVPYGADLVEALVRSGDGPAAAEATSRHTERALRTESPWALATSARCRALVAADAQVAEAHFTQAIAGLPSRSFEAGRTLLCWGEQRRRQRDGRGARELLRRAAVIFDDLGARPWARRARSELGALGVHGPPAPLLLDGLTPQELQVALAVAAGQRNKEVAAALFISPKTVEHHLGHVYTKLNVQSRTQLAAALSRPPLYQGRR